MKTALFVAAASTWLALNARAVDYSASVRPILTDHCFQCHGPDEGTLEAELRLDTEEGIEYAFAGGMLDESEAWRRIVSDDPDEQMPPPDYDKPLTPEQIDILKEWMSQGAAWSEHWAFIKPGKEVPPEAIEEDHPIDKFVRARLRRAGLEHSPSASRETLIRRLKFDLLGLPPTTEEIDHFLSDTSHDAYERLVDRFLESPHFGEHMAVQWLDGARYADTNGYQNDFKRSMWPWRDWVIDAFNANMPYDQFVIEQIAGDLLPDPTLQQRIATGFNRNNRTVTEFGSIEQEWLVENVVDRVETTSAVFLGLTLGCARCHDHKYDPVSQREFYEFFSFFYNVKEKGVFQEARGNTDPLVPVLPAEELSRLDDLKATEAEAETSFKELRKQLNEQATQWRPPMPEATQEDALPDSPFRLPLEGTTDAQLADGNVLLPTTETGNVVWNDEIFGKAAKFSGLHTLEYADAVAPDFDKPFTFVFWIKPEKMGAVLDKIDLKQLSRGFDIYWKQPGKLEMHIISSWPDDAMKVSTEKEGVVPANTWSHIAISYDGSGKAAGVTLWVNGLEVALKVEVDQLKSAFAVDQPLRLAGTSRGFTFFGTVNDLRYYEAVLDRAQVQTAIEQGLAKMPDLSGKQLSSNQHKELGELFGNFSRNEFAKKYREARDFVAATQAKITELIESYPTAMVMEELAAPRQAYVLTRGEYDKPDKSQPVSADVPDFLGELPSEMEPSRLALANWMVSPENPLTARVRVNRIWELLFGTGIVKTSENFGVQAEPPSHPELLNWLTNEFIASGWDTKGLIRLIVTSKTYRQSSVISDQHSQRDPANRLLARGPRFRLSAEMVRDNALAVSGLLTTHVGGESIKPYQPEGLWDELAGGASEGPYVQSHGEDLYRRSLYIYRKRTVPHPVTNTFDAPSFEICQVARTRTNTPLQALALLNDVTYLEAARKLGERMLVEGGDSDREKLTYGFRLATGRRPNSRELEILAQGCERKRVMFAGDVERAKTYVSHGEADSDSQIPVTELATYTAMGSVLLNLDETITKE